MSTFLDDIIEGVATAAAADAPISQQDAVEQAVAAAPEGAAGVAAPAAAVEADHDCDTLAVFLTGMLHTAFPRGFPCNQAEPGASPATLAASAAAADNVHASCETSQQSAQPDADTVSDLSDPSERRNLPDGPALHDGNNKRQRLMAIDEVLNNHAADGQASSNSAVANRGSASDSEDDAMSAGVDADVVGALEDLISSCENPAAHAAQSLLDTLIGNCERAVNQMSVPLPPPGFGRVLATLMGTAPLASATKTRAELKLWSDMEWAAAGHSAWYVVVPLLESMPAEDHAPVAEPVGANGHAEERFVAEVAINWPKLETYAEGYLVGCSGPS